MIYIDNFDFLKPLKKIRPSKVLQSYGYFLSQNDNPKSPDSPCCFGAHFAAIYCDPIDPIFDFTGWPHDVFCYNNGLKKFFEMLYPASPEQIYEMFAALGITANKDQSPFGKKDWEVPFNEAIELLEIKGPAILRDIMEDDFAKEVP